MKLLYHWTIDQDLDIFLREDGYLRLMPTRFVVYPDDGGTHPDFESDVLASRDRKVLVYILRGEQK